MKEIEQAWVATTKMAVEARKAGVSLDNAFELLRSAKSVLNERGHGHAAEVSRAEEMLAEAQKEIFSKAELLGKKFSEKWSRALKKAAEGEKIGEFSIWESKFYPAAPKDSRWVRVSLPKTLSIKKLEEIAKRCGAAVEPQEKRHVIISGDKDSLRKALDEISPYFKV